MKNQLRKIIRGLTALGLIALTACGGGTSGGSGTTTAGNTSITGSDRMVTIGQLDESGQSLITMELGVFGDAEEDLAGATISISVNGETVYEVTASDHYDSASGTVRFYLSGLTDGDNLTFTITLADGTVEVFSGTVSSSADSYAELVSNTGDDYDVDEETVIAEGFEALATRNLSGAQTLYCDAYNAGSTDSEVAFGCFLTTFLALPETSEMAEILSSLGVEGEVDAVEEMADIIEIRDNGPISCSQQYRYYRLDNLDGVWDCVEDRGLYFALLDVVATSRGNKFDLGLDIVQRLVASGATIAELNDEIYALSGDFEAMEDMLEIVVADPDFSFVVPWKITTHSYTTEGSSEDSYTTEGSSEDHTVYPTDVKLFLAGVKGTLVGLDIMASYDLGFEPENILASDGEHTDAEALVADLNGTGETVNGHTVDTTAFLTLVNEGLVTASKGRFIDALDYAVEGLQAFQDGQNSEVFHRGDSFEDTAISGDLTETIAKAEGLLASVESGTPYEIYFDDGASASINLKTFFDNPPSSTDVTNSDPFVVAESSGTDQVVSVESWWQEFFDGIVEF